MIDVGLNIANLPVRGKVRHKIALAVNGISAFGDNVYSDRNYALNANEYPAAIIRSGDEHIEPATKQNNPGMQKRLVETHVFVFVKGPDNIQMESDKLSKLVEEAVLQDGTLGNIAVETLLVSNLDFVGGEPNAPVSVLDMVFMSTVFTKAGTPTQSLNRATPFS